MSRLMPKQRKEPSQTWKTFLTNHVGQLVSIDLFTVPTLRLKVLFVFVVLAHERRRVLHFNVTEHPTAKSLCVFEITLGNYCYSQSDLTKQQDLWNF